MDLRQIQYFICLYEEGSVTRAARRLSIVQPALSMQLARLEDDLGQKLFERNSQGMVPTAAARQMYRLFLPILQDFSRAREQVMCSDDEITGHVNIGLIASITAGVLADTLAVFSARYPKVGVTIADGYSTTLSGWVMGGQIEAAVVNGVRRHGQLKVDHITDEDLVLVTSASHPSPPPARLTLQQVAQLGIGLVLPTRNHGLRDVIDGFAHNEEVELAPVYEVDSLLTMTRLVESTQLATILPRIVVNERVEAGALQLHTVVSPRLTRQVVLVSHPRRPLSPASAAFVAILKAQILLKTQGLEPAS
jgi:LysR family nitrogen assimilation transcriptional regulator